VGDPERGVLCHAHGSAGSPAQGSVSHTRAMLHQEMVKGRAKQRDQKDGASGAPKGEEGGQQ
jgi:hypothetical protein